MKSEQVLFCILNYKHSENAIKWAESLKNDFSVSILDTYVLDNPNSNDPLLNYDGNTLFYHNIFLGGITFEAFKICIGGGFKFLCIITSDVEIDEDNLQHLKARIRNLPDDIGIYEVSADKDSCIMGVVGAIPYTERYFVQSEEDFKESGLAEGWLYGINVECIKHIIPFFSPEKHKHAWGIGDKLLSISKSKGYRNVIDSKVFVHHPAGTSYNAKEAINEWYSFDRMSEQMGVPESFITIVYCTKKHNENYKKYLISYFSDAALIKERICNTDNIKEILACYNEEIKESKTNALLLLHENTYFAWLNHAPEIYDCTFQKIFFKNKEFGIIGCAGKHISNNGIIERGSSPVFAFGEGNGEPVIYQSSYGTLYSDEVFEDAIVDGRFLAVRKDRIKHLFNVEENVPYDDEFCISNYLDGVKVGVTKVLLPYYPVKNSDNEVEINNLMKKYNNKLPIKV